VAIPRVQPTAAIADRIGAGPYQTLLAAARCGVGLAAIIRPATALRATGLDRATAERAAWTARLLGGRDLALGFGLLHAVARRLPTHGWVAAGLIADSVDVVVLSTATARRDLSPAAGTLAALLGASGVAAGLPILAGIHPRTPAADEGDTDAP
jgi:hypothetical protein